MSAELSITLARLKKEAVSIVGSGRTYAQPVTDELSQRAVPEEGQPAPDFLAIQLGLVRMVEADLEQIETFDELLVRELDEDREKLAERNAATVQLTSELSSVQDATDGVYGTDARLKLFGHVDTLPRDPDQLVKLGQRVSRRLGDETYGLPEPRLKSWALSDRQNLATDLGKPVDRLAEALDALNKERKSSVGSRFVKSGALDGFRRTLRYAGDCLASLYGLAGFDDLAARIRPKRRRRRRAAGDDGGEPSEGATESPSQDGDDATPEPPAGPRLVVS